MINLTLRLFEHPLERIPLNTPIMEMGPTCTPVNAALLFGHKPKIYRAFIIENGCRRYIDYDDPLFSICSVELGDESYVRTSAQFMRDRVLWCSRAVPRPNLEKILTYLKIQHDVPEPDDEDERAKRRANKSPARYYPEDDDPFDEY